MALGQLPYKTWSLSDYVVDILTHFLQFLQIHFSFETYLFLNSLYDTTVSRSSYFHKESFYDHRRLLHNHSI